MSNTLGHNLCFTSFGESHGNAIGGVLDGFPARFAINVDEILAALRERAGEGIFGVSPRALVEPDQIEWLSGVSFDSCVSPVSETRAFQARNEQSLLTLGSPIAFIIRNHSARPQDYDTILNSQFSTLNSSRPDQVYISKYGIQPTGGGRASGRETVSRVVAGNMAEQWLREQCGIQISAAVETVGGLPYPSEEATTLLQTLQNEYDSIGATIKCEIVQENSGTLELKNSGTFLLGNPLFDKLTSRLAAAVFSIGGTTGISFEPDAETKRASIRNTQPHGIVAGIATGEPITFWVTFHATPSINLKGRHDLCFALRTPVIVRAMTALTLMDLAL